jgi:hypothetical protein
MCDIVDDQNGIRTPGTILVKHDRLFNERKPPELRFAMRAEDDVMKRNPMRLHASERG